MPDDKRWDLGSEPPVPMPPAQAVYPTPVYMQGADRLLVAEIVRLNGELAKFAAAVGRLHGYLESQDPEADGEGVFKRVDQDHILDLFAGLVPGIPSA